MTDDIQKYWPQLAALALFAFALGSAHYRINALAEDKVSRDETEQLAGDERNEIKRQLTALKTKQDDVVKDVDEIKKDVKEILKELRKD